MKKIKYIIFDFDGTIADTIPYTFNKLLKFLKEEKVDTTEKEFLINIKSKNFQELIKEWQLSWVKLPFILAKIKQMQEDLYYEIDKVAMFPGIDTLLKNLNNEGLSLAILSSNLEKNVNKFLTANKLKMFKNIDCGSQILGKAGAIKDFIKKNNYKLEESIYIGDELRDVEACKKVGIKIIGVSWGMHSNEALKKAGVDYLVNKPSEIFKIISN